MSKVALSWNDVFELTSVFLKREFSHFIFQICWSVMIDTLLLCGKTFFRFSRYITPKIALHVFWWCNEENRLDVVDLKEKTVSYRNLDRNERFLLYCIKVRNDQLIKQSSAMYFYSRFYYSVTPSLLKKTKGA